MPKTNKRFDWEIYDENKEFVDMLTMTRNEMKDYKKKFPKYNIKEISYAENGDNDAW